MNVRVRQLGVEDYEVTWRRMREFVDARTTETVDEFWCLEHHPVYTLGLGATASHILNAGGIPVVRSDRGGQVTYHCPGQLVVYVLADLRRIGVGPRELVRRLESALIHLLADYGIVGERRSGAPGVYVAAAKIAALGLRIRKGCCYHGLALNVDPELEPFSRINPCGYAGLEVTSLARLGCTTSIGEVAAALVPRLSQALYALPAEDAQASPSAHNSANNAGPLQRGLLAT